MRREKQAAEPRKFLLPLVALGVLVAVAGGLSLLPVSSPSATSLAAAPPAGGTGEPFTGDREETERLIAYNRSIELTPEQHEVYREALDGLRAPCCDRYSAATCCCECNMARATWGLAKHLVAEKELGANEVRTAVADWFETINPDGFTGDACFTGGCGRPFAKNGCGGMSESRLVF